MNILVFCTYPISNPRHGGQLRVRNIVDRYRAQGHRVQVVGILGSESYEQEPGFINFPGVVQLSKFINNSFLMEDYALGRWISNDSGASQQLASMIEIKPDLVQVEHPWLFEFAHCYVKENFPKVPIVYSAHNIEWLLKQEMLLSYYPDTIALKYGQLIKDVELDAISSSDAIICVSQNDAKWIRSHTKKSVVIAPNGVKPWRTTLAGVNEAKTITGDCSYALYCASAHPPNMTGFFTMLGGGFGSLKPDEKLVIAGGASISITGDVRIHKSAKLAEKVVAAGIVSQSCLEGLLDDAHCIVLPLTQGGGTNLKTAEALLAGKYIVATSIAMRGFEQFIGAKGIYLADDPGVYKRALRNAMESPPLVLSKEEARERYCVVWDRCLEPLTDFIDNLI